VDLNEIVGIAGNVLSMFMFVWFLAAMVSRVARKVGKRRRKL